MTILDEIAAERRRQIINEGYTPTHDDTHVNGELALGAAAYAIPDKIRSWMEGNDIHLWPFLGDFKPRTARDNLIRAAAMIVAEIERLDRAAAAGKED